ncbi:MAG: DUF2203 domain-containing protein, partial [Acidobacteria bacterium]|nr:DUF2203 domain-containing protein [Acidobacteriota bacterium]
EPLLIEAMEARRRAEELNSSLARLAAKVMMAGGLLLRYEDVARKRATLDKLQQTIESALDTIHSTGCVVKDLDAGLLDFPAVLDNQEVYLCWRLGEDRIRYYHGIKEGFAGRKPLDPRDPGPRNPVQ